MQEDRKAKARRRYTAEHKFSKIAALNRDIDAGGSAAVAARQQKRKISDHWFKRGGNNPGAFWKATNATPGTGYFLKA